MAQSGALWDICLVHCGTCQMGPLIVANVLHFSMHVSGDNGAGNIFSLGDLLIALGTYMSCVLIYSLHPEVLTDGVGQLYSFVLRCLTDGKGWPMVACPFQPLVVWYEMSNVWATVSTFVHLPGMFRSTDFLFKKTIGVVTMDLLCIMFTY